MYDVWVWNVLPFGYQLIACLQVLPISFPTTPRAEIMSGQFEVGPHEPQRKGFYVPSIPKTLQDSPPHAPMESPQFLLGQETYNS
jgi:hypothetical protein